MIASCSVSDLSAKLTLPASSTARWSPPRRQITPSTISSSGSRSCTPASAFLALDCIQFLSSLDRSRDIRGFRDHDFIARRFLLDACARLPRAPDRYARSRPVTEQDEHPVFHRPSARPPESHNRDRDKYDACRDQPHGYRERQLAGGAIRHAQSNRGG